MGRIKSTDVKTRQRENYQRLREAGFDSQTAARLRGASTEKIEKAISSKLAPLPVDTQRRHIRLPEKSTEFKNSTQKTITLTDYTPAYIEAALNQIIRGEQQGYTNYSVTTRFHFKDGSIQARSTRMYYIGDLSGIDKASALADLSSQTAEKVQEEGRKYAWTMALVEYVDLEINLWRWKKTSRKGGKKYAR